MSGAARAHFQIPETCAFDIRAICYITGIANQAP